MKNMFLIFTLLVTISCNLVSKKSFLIPKEKTKIRVSKNVLKENIGDSLKNALYSCNTISSELGVLQKKLADLQRKLLSRVELLIDNKKPFKRAKKSELSNTLKVLSGIELLLKNQGEYVKKIVVQMDKNKCLKNG